jgi:hypothetical protein
VTAVAGGATGAVLAAWRERQNLSWQATDAWLTEIRTALDAAAGASTQVVYALDRRGTATDSDRDQLGAEAFARLMDAEVAGCRIGMRIGSEGNSPEWDQLLEAMQHLSGLAYDHGDKPVRDLPLEQQGEWAKARGAVTTSRAAFVAATERWLNGQERELPGRPRSSPARLRWPRHDRRAERSRAAVPMPQRSAGKSG